MIPNEVINLLSVIKSTANPAYYKDKKKIVEQIYSFTSSEQCFKELRSSDAWRILKREKQLLEPLEKSNRDIYLQVELLAECHQGSL